MQEDFHYYATYSAAFLAGYSHEESLDICYCSQFTDLCTKTFLASVGAPKEAATTQLMTELLETKSTTTSLQDVTRIWASFHFLPYDLYAECKKGSKRYKRKYRMICNSNSSLIEETVGLAKGKSVQAVGLAMHVLADTWAHKYFAGTPSMVINNTDRNFSELIPEGDGFTERPIRFSNNPREKDDPETSTYVNSVFQVSENTIMNLGHGRAGHLPDYGYIRYKYMPAWAGYEEVLKDNPSDYKHAFAQMIYAMKRLRLQDTDFVKNQYDWEAMEPYMADIETILSIRQIDACADWKALGEKISGQEIPAFDAKKYAEEYKNAKEEDKDKTFLGRYVLAALAQKSLVTKRVFESKSKLAGVSIDYSEKHGVKGMKDYSGLVDYKRGDKNE